MKIYLFSILLISILGSCAIYTQPNKAKNKDDLNITGTFQPENHQDVIDKYSYGMITFPFPILSEELNKYSTTLPLGIQFVGTNDKLGELTGNLFYMVEGYELSPGAGDILSSANRRFKPQFMYAHRVWHRIETIDNFSIELGSYNKTVYTAFLPVNISVELSVRGGYDKQMLNFNSWDLTEYMAEQYPNNGVKYKARHYQQMNGAMKFGVAFQRKLATTFDVPLQYVKMKAATFDYQSLYADISVLVQPDNTIYYVSPTYDDVASEVYPENKPSVYKIIQQKDFLKIHPIGFSLGYQRFCRPDMGRMSLSMVGEIGIFPGHYDRFSNGFYAKIGVGVGLGFNKM